MPLFVFLSGYFSYKKDGKNLCNSIWKLAEPFILFQTIALLPKLIFNSSSISFNELLTPRWVLWYLLSLIIWRLTLQIIPDKLLNHKTLIIFITFCISIIAGFLPFDRLLSLQRTLAFIPFFFLGYYMKGYNLFLPPKFKIFSLMFLVSTIAIPIFFLHYLGNVCHSDPFRNSYELYGRIITFCLCIPMSIAFMNLSINTSWIASQGRLTMQYYIYHALIVFPLSVVVTKLGINTSLLFNFICIVIVLIILGIASQFSYFVKSTNPSQIIIKLIARYNKEV